MKTTDRNSDSVIRIASLAVAVEQLRVVNDRLAKQQARKSWIPRAAAAVAAVSISVVAGCAGQVVPSSAHDVESIEEGCTHQQNAEFESSTAGVLYATHTFDGATLAELVDVTALGTYADGQRSMSVMLPLDGSGTVRVDCGVIYPTKQADGSVNTNNYSGARSVTFTRVVR